MDFFCEFSPIMIVVLYFNHIKFCTEVDIASYLIERLEKFLTRYLGEYSSKEKLALRNEYYKLKRRTNEYINCISNTKTNLGISMLFLKESKEFPIHLLQNFKKLKRSSKNYNNTLLSEFIAYLQSILEKLDAQTFSELKKIEKTEYWYKDYFKEKFDFFNMQSSYHLLIEDIEYTEETDLYKFSRQLFSVIRYFRAKWIPEEEGKKLYAIFQEILRKFKAIKTVKREIKRAEEREKLNKYSVMSDTFASQKTSYHFSNKLLKSKRATVVAIAAIIIIAFIVSTPLFFLKPHITYLHIKEGESIARVGEPIRFSWVIIKYYLILWNIYK